MELRAFKLRLPSKIAIEVKVGDEVKFNPNKPNVFLYTRFIGKSRVDGQHMFTIDKYEGEVPEELNYIFDGRTSVIHNNHSTYTGGIYPSLISTFEDDRPITINDL